MWKPPPNTCGYSGWTARHPSAIVDIFAPVSGVIIEQNVTAAAGVKTLDNSPNLFTIADLSEIWIICDVYENDLATVRLGEFADVRLNAYPRESFPGTRQQHRTDSRPQYSHGESTS